jgi:hypothetical protein
MPGVNPPPAYVAPPFAFAWLPITVSVVVSSAVHETAGFQDGKEPGAVALPKTENGCESRRLEESNNADSTRALVNAIFRFEEVCVEPLTVVPLLPSMGRR